MMDTANVILLRMLEVKAKEMELEKYIMQMLGETGEKGKMIKEMVEESFPYMSGIAEKKEKKEWFEWKYREEEEESKAKKTAKKVVEFLNNIGINTTVRFFKPGPYETHVEDVITGIWVPEFSSAIQMPSINFFKDALGVPGAKASYR